jgi:hypothetical protein
MDRSARFGPFTGRRLASPPVRVDNNGHKLSVCRPLLEMPLFIHYVHSFIHWNIREKYEADYDAVNLARSNDDRHQGSEVVEVIQSELDRCGLQPIFFITMVWWFC